MVRTDFTAELKKGFAHPVDARLISDKLNETPLYEQLGISFEREEGEFMISYIPSSAQKEMYFGAKRDMQGIEAKIMAYYSSPKDQWQIQVFATREKYAPAIGDYLSRIGLKKLRSWLESYNSTWNKGHRMFILGLNDGMTESCILELHNETLINLKIEKVKI